MISSSATTTRLLGVPLWVADITYARTWQGWLHVAVVLDCFSR
jgi:transposase InsO family protein